MSRVPNMHRKGSPQHLLFTVIIVSDTRFKQSKSGEELHDETTPLIKRMLRRKRYKLLTAEIVPDQKKAVKDAIENHIDQHHPHVIILSGGTGISPRDITYEVVKELIVKEIDGFGELFRWLSYQDIGTAAMLSRTIAGIHKKTFIVSLPGSPDAVRLAMEKLIIPEAGHIINLIHEVGKE